MKEGGDKMRQAEKLNKLCVGIKADWQAKK